ncbi:MAG: hypothetical protein AB1894_09915 [Chloroflexota bacterium]
MQKSFSILTLVVIFVLVLAILPAPQANSYAQSGSNNWTAPVNLSNSGAASEPRLFAASNGEVQVFWLDRFDGLTTALYNGSAWSLPTQSGVINPRLGQAAIKIEEIPFFYESDASDRLYAFIYGSEIPSTKEAPLYFGQMTFGSTLWSNLQQVVEAARTFDVTATSDGEIKLAYIRPLKSSLYNLLEGDPGVYLRSTLSRASAWKTPIPVHLSIYYRILDPEQAYLKAASSGSFITLAWFEPRLEQVLTSDSFNAGASWTEPKTIDAPGSRPANPMLAVLPNGSLLRIWQDAAQPGCVLYQQHISIPLPPPGPTATPPFGPTPTASAATAPAEWGQPQRILENLQTCPTGSHFFSNQDTLFWAWGEGSNVLSLSAWDDTNARWSLPQEFSFSFEDAATARTVQLSNLHMDLAGDKLAVTGADEDASEIWVTFTQLSALEIAFAPPSPWSKALPISKSSEERQGAGQPGSPSLALDSQDRAHMVWSTASNLFYARYDSQGVTSPAEIVKSAAGEIVRQPALIIDEPDRLHLAWSGGPNGQLNYSRAETNQAGTAAGWLPAKQLDTRANISWPQIAIGPSGGIFILYTIPINEGRGVYLVSSFDNGENWGQPELVFDAAAAGWEGVDHATLQIAPDGNLLAAFARLSLASSSPTEGLFFALSTVAPLQASTETSWSVPTEVAGASADWPRLDLVGEQLHLLYITSNGLQQRWMPLEQMTLEGVGWGGESRVPGWQDLSTSSLPPYALVSDARTMHLVSALPSGSTLRYSTWGIPESNPTAGRWGPVETYASLEHWTNLSGNAAAVHLTGGTLAAAWLAIPPVANTGTASAQLPSVYFITRKVDVVSAIPTPEVIVTNEPTPAATDIPTPTPWPTPTLSPDLPLTPEEQPISPLIVGGGLAAVIVMVIFTVILLREQKR